MSQTVEKPAKAVYVTPTVTPMGNLFSNIEAEQVERVHLSDDLIRDTRQSGYERNQLWEAIEMDPKATAYFLALLIVPVLAVLAMAGGFIFAAIAAWHWLAAPH